MEGVLLIMFKRGIVLCAVLIIGLGALVSGCGDIIEDEEGLEIGMVAWACAEAQTYVAKVVLEDHMDYDVTVTTLEPAAVYSALSEGDLDIFMAAWLPVTHEDYWDEYGDVLNQHNAHYDGARIGLTVPDYVDIDSIEELNEHADMFDGEIVGIDAGAGIMRATEDAMDVYDMDDLELIESSDIAMAAALGDAIMADEPIVVTGWTPHWKFAEYDLKFLEDPEQVYGEAEQIYAVSRPGFPEINPDVSGLLDRFTLDDEDVGEVMAAIEDGEEPIDAARAWVEANEDVVDQWLPELELEEPEVE